MKLNKKIKFIKNWFIIPKLGKNGALKASTYRELRRDALNVATRLETIVNGDLKKWHFEAQRKRVKLMLESIEIIDSTMHRLAKEGSRHNCFYVRTRTEQLKNFLYKYSKLLDTYNNKFLEKIHGAVEFNQHRGLIIKDNLIIKEGGEIEIISK